MSRYGTRFGSASGWWPARARRVDPDRSPRETIAATTRVSHRHRPHPRAGPDAAHRPAGRAGPGEGLCHRPFEPMCPDGAVFRASCANVVTDVIRDDVDGTRSYLLHCERSSGQFLFDALLDAGAEFAIDVEGFQTGPVGAEDSGPAVLQLHFNAVSFLQMTDLAVRGSPLEYWFFRLNTGPLAFLVDFIIRREFRAAEVRVSLWVDGLGRVERVHSTAWRTEGETVDTAGCTIGPQRTTGRVEDVEWDLSLELGSSRIDPAVPPVRLLHPFDMEIASRPRARFSGQVTVGDRTFPCVDVPGLVSHYWGRRLPDRWWWVSANKFEDSDVAVEALFARTRIWNLARVPMYAGYLWVEHQGMVQRVIHPLNGLIRVEGSPESFTLL